MLVWMAVLSILVLLFTPFLGVPISLEHDLFLDARPIQHWMFLAAVPWMMAGGLLGLLPSVVLAGMSGLLLAYLDTNTIFTPLILMTASASFSWAVRQRIRTKPYQLLRFPLFAVIFSSVISFPSLFIAIMLGIDGAFPLRLAAAFAQVPLAMLPLVGMMLIGGLVCVVTRAAFNDKWGSKQSLKYPPGKFSLKFRVIALTISVLAIIYILMFSILWFSEVDTARQTLITNLMGSSSAAAEGLPMIISSEQDWISTDISSNPYFKLFKNDVSEIEHQGGSFQIVDEKHLYVYHSDPKLVLTAYAGPAPSTPTYFEYLSEDGPSMMQYIHPVNELDWAVIASVPVQIQYEVAWESIKHLAMFGLITILVVIFIELIAFEPASKQIRQVKNGMEAVSAGKFDYKINRHPNLGEMTQLTNAYNQMVSSLLHKWQKQSDLLSLNERLSGQNNFNAAMEIIMKTALAHGVSSVRIILSGKSGSMVSDSTAKRFGMGKQNNHYAGLDDQIFDQVQSEGILILSDFRERNPLRWNEGLPAPSSIIAVPINQGSTLTGVLWVTYQNLRFPDDEEVVFFKNLAQKTSVSILNLSTLDSATGIRIQLEKFLDLLPEAIAITDGSGNLVFSNDAAMDLFNLDDNDPQTIPFSTLLLEAETIKTKHSSQGNSSEKEIKTVDGKFLKVSETEIEEKGQLGKAYLISDISSQRAQDAKRNDFVTTASHELRSPLALIHGYAKILQLTGNLNEQQDDYINNIIDGIEEMKDLVRKLLDIGHLDEGDFLDITHFFASDLINKVVDNLDAQAKQKNIQVRYQRPESPVPLEADRTYLTLALRNVLENAIKFTKMGGDVSIGIRKQGGDVVFSVKDNGIGIAPLDQRPIFEKFYRGQTQVEQEQSGSGLGLAIVKSIAERHGGKVSVDSQLGRGSTFSIQVPQRPKASPNTMDF